MFADRFWGWKMAAALALIAAMGIDAERRGQNLNPALWRCLAQPAQWDGTRILVPSARVLEVGDSWAEISATDARIRVVGPPPGAVGDAVSLVGIFRAEGPRIELERSRSTHWRRDWRWLSELVSILVLLGILANFARHFLFRPSVLHVKGRD